MADNTVFSFARHCMTDDEFLCGGIPTKESYYLKKLGWTEDSPETNEFYTAMCNLAALQRTTGSEPVRKNRAHNCAYWVEYKMHSADEVHGMQIIASSKEKAYDNFMREMERQGEMPYSAWVSSVTYNNGRYKVFNTFEGKPF